MLREGGGVEDADAVGRAVAAPVEASGVVVGAAGTGKTAALIARVRALVEAGVGIDELVVLTPTRQTATALRDELAFAVDRATAGPLARSVASLAFQIVRTAAAYDGAEPPRLLTAGDEDRIVQDLLDGDAEDEAAGMPTRWPAWIDASIRATPGFRGEVRAFLAECASLGIGPRRLRALARSGPAQTPVWEAMASFAAEYHGVRERMRGAHRDAAALEREAAAIVAAGGAGRLGAAGDLRAVLVDDAQELTAGAVELLDALRARGIGVVAFGDPDLGSGAFRGARPEHFARMAGSWGVLAVLREPRRGTPVQHDLIRSIAGAIGAVGVIEHRVPPSGAEPDGSVGAVVARSQAEEYDAIARMLRERHVHDGVPWRACAVIAHDSRQVRALEAELSAREVPARAAGARTPLGAERAVRDLLRLVLLAVEEPAEWTPEEVTAALLGAGLDPAELRRLRTAARFAERAADGDRPAAALLVSGMRYPLEWSLLGTREGDRAARVAETVGLLRDALAAGATAHELVWLPWERSGNERRWAEAARGRGPIAQQARRDLAAVASLMQAAKRFSEQSPTEPLPFVRAVRDAEIGEDRLDEERDDGRVAVLTPAATVGRTFDTVVIAGVQDGRWPNTRPRGSLLETWRLADPGHEPRDRRRSMLHDELRLFARACSRATARLVVTAVDDDDTGPSILFSFLPEPVRREQRATMPLSLRGLVAQHRRALTERGTGPARQEHAARQLALLADAGIPGAVPAEWYGILPPTSAGALRGDEAVVRVSPSRLHAIEECPLNWAIGELGGDSATTGAGLGTILHSALETTAGADEEALWAAVEARWGELEFDAAWRDRAERVRARDMVRRLALYVRRFEEAGGRLVRAEPRFDIPIPEDAADAADAAARTILSGYIDRVELTAEGEVVIVDLKTGKREPQTDEKVADHPQLAAYQLAHEAGAIEEAAGLPLAGARLLVLRPTAKTADYKTPHQPPFDDATRGAFLARVRGAADLMRSAGFLAPYEEHCRDDHSYGLCRIHTIGSVSAS
ncbi:PD-(D/E)XK nuclease family protein [Microbacterium sp. X-17]|uniref:PD-(D/E)XK nuclease family protein n=1 Tax=Microbacterium sp. X-17 TaxID=3144404 RepID=UPI0031F4A43F